MKIGPVNSHNNLDYKTITRIPIGKIHECVVILMNPAIVYHNDLTGH